MASMGGPHYPQQFYRQFDHGFGGQLPPPNFHPMLMRPPPVMYSSQLPVVPYQQASGPSSYQARGQSSLELSSHSPRSNSEHSSHSPRRIHSETISTSTEVVAQVVQQTDNNGNQSNKLIVAIENVSVVAASNERTSDEHLNALPQLVTASMKLSDDHKIYLVGANSVNSDPVNTNVDNDKTVNILCSGEVLTVAHDPKNCTESTSNHNDDHFSQESSSINSAKMAEAGCTDCSNTISSHNVTVSSSNSSDVYTTSSSLSPVSSEVDASNILSSSNNIEVTTSCVSATATIQTETLTVTATASAAVSSSAAKKSKSSRLAVQFKN